jgi:uncharacterized protein (DUF305 family)
VRTSGVVALGIAGALSGACASAPRAAAPAAASPATVVAAPPARDTVRHGYTAADVRFMQQMIHHHAQAVRMAALVPSRSGSEAVRTLAQRIDASQQTEIEAMRHWLEERRELAPGPAMPRAVHDSIMGAMHDMPMHDMPMHDMPAMHHPATSADSGEMAGMLMPGMLTPAQMRALAAASGTAFDRLFLEGMIRHHEGALTMVADLLATPGAGQEPQLFGFASDVDSGQRAEIRRMQAILATLPPPDSVPRR